jgi:hypothetical protein
VKRLINKYLFLLFFGIVAISCSSNLIDSSLRSPAAIEKSCFEIANSLINNHSSVIKPSDEKFLPHFFPNISLSSVIKKRKVMRERYDKIVESIRDFDIHPDVPTNGKTK